MLKAPLKASKLHIRVFFRLQADSLAGEELQAVVNATEKRLPLSAFHRKTMDSDSSIACRTAYNACVRHDIENNITEPDFEHGCWKSFLDLCLPTERPTQVGSSRASLALEIPLILVAVLSIATNSLVCIVFFLYRQLRLIRHYFVINLAVADILIAAILIPLFVAAQLVTDNIALCRCQIVLDIACGTASILCLAMISLERYVAVKYSLHYHSIVTQRKAIFCMVFIWVYSLIVSCAAFLSLLKESDNDSCLFVGREYVTFITISSFVAPVGVMAFSYWNIFLVALTHARRIDSLSMHGVHDGSGHSKRRIKRELKGAKTLTIIMGTHFVCWCPLFVFLLVYTYCPSCRGDTMKIANYVILFLRHFNSFSNPIIYSGINKQFRAAIMRFVLRRSDSIEELQTTAGTRA